MQAQKRNEIEILTKEELQLIIVTKTSLLIDNYYIAEIDKYLGLTLRKCKI